MKKMCPPGYHHNGFVATHALGRCGDNREGITFELFIVKFVNFISAMGTFGKFHGGREGNNYEIIRISLFV